MSTPTLYDFYVWWLEAVAEIINELNTENETTALILQDAADEIERLQKLIPQPPTFRIVDALVGHYFIQREDTRTNYGVVACGMDYETAKTLLTALIRYNPKAQANGQL